MNQLAAAHERDLIHQGSSVHITLDYNINKVVHGQAPVKEETPAIKLQLIKEGSKNIDIKVDDVLDHSSLF